MPGIAGVTNLNSVSLSTSSTKKEPLYELIAVVIPAIKTGVSLNNPCFLSVSTVMILVGVLPSPALIEVIPTGSAARSPTILNSSTLGSKSVNVG